MFEPLTIRSHRFDYTIKFTARHLPALVENIRDRDIIFIDKNIFAMYHEIAEIVLQRQYRLIESSEQAKSFSALESIINDLLATGITKTDRIVAIGGGVVQDISAFVASILFRGIDWIFFPTNLLSQADSCIGSKTSINFKDYKNQIGGFYPPRNIIIASSFLQTLPERDLFSGLGEMFHYFCISGNDDFTWAANLLSSVLRDRAGLDEMIHRSLLIKKAMIEIDEFDTGPRNVFNYGHSFGHALETVTQYRLPHGIAVCFGMDLANCISVQMGFVSCELRNEIRQTLSPLWSETDMPVFDKELFIVALGRDKKNEGANIKVILTRGLGQMFKETLVLDSQMRGVIDHYFKHRQWERDL